MAAREHKSWCIKYTNFRTARGGVGWEGDEWRGVDGSSGKRKGAGLRIRITLFLKAGSGSVKERKDGSGSALKSKFGGSKLNPGGRGRPQERKKERNLEAWRLNMEPRRVYRPVVADSHHFDEEQDPYPHESEKLNPDPDQH
jgi:hypothetical protein